MSYLLSNRSKKRKAVGFGVARVRTSLSAYSGAGAQILQQLPIQQNRQRTLALAMQQQPGNGVLSMEEVIADLCILQQQQDESERKLKLAQENKSRCLHQQATSEDHLEKLKYSNGEHRAELRRARALLSEGQRKLAEVRISEDSTNHGLRAFDRKVNKSFEIKRTLHAYERKHDAKLAELRKQLLLLERLSRDAKEQHEVAQAEYDRIKDFESFLRQSIKGDTELQERIANETLQVRRISSAQENALDLSLKRECERNREVAELLELANTSEDSHTKRMNALQNRQDEVHQRTLELSLNKDRAHETGEKKKQELQTMWHRVIQIQKIEGHQLPPSSNHPRDLDLEALRESVQVEAKAATEETIAKKGLLVRIESLRAHLGILQVEHADIISRVQNVETTNEETIKLEKERNEAIANRKVELDSINKQVTTKAETIAKIRAAHEDQVNMLMKQTDEVRDCVQTRKYRLSEMQQKYQNLDSTVITLRENVEKVKNAYDFKLERKKEEVKRTTIELLKLKTKSCEAEAQSNTNNYKSKIADCKAEIARIKKECPLLETVAFTYRPDIRSVRQGDIDLKEFESNIRKQTKHIASKINATRQNKVVGGKRLDSKPQMEDKSQLSIPGDSAEDQHIMKVSNIEKEVCKESAVKPRLLLSSLATADEEEHSDLEGSFETEKIQVEQTRQHILDHCFHSKSVTWRDQDMSDSGNSSVDLSPTKSRNIVRHVQPLCVSSSIAQSVRNSAKLTHYQSSPRPHHADTNEVASSTDCKSTNCSSQNRKFPTSQTSDDDIFSEHAPFHHSKLTKKEKCDDAAVSQRNRQARVGSPKRSYHFNITEGSNSNSGKRAHYSASSVQSEKNGGKKTEVNNSKGFAEMVASKLHSPVSSVVGKKSQHKKIHNSGSLNMRKTHPKRGHHTKDESTNCRTSFNRKIHIDERKKESAFDLVKSPQSINNTHSSNGSKATKNIRSAVTSTIATSNSNQKIKQKSHHSFQQASGISSQERPSVAKGRRRFQQMQRDSGIASKKPRVDADDYSFEF